MILFIVLKLHLLYPEVLYEQDVDSHDTRLRHSKKLYTIILFLFVHIFNYNFNVYPKMLPVALDYIV